VLEAGRAHALAPSEPAPAHRIALGLAAEPFELSPGATVDRLSGVDVDATMLGDRLVEVLRGSFGSGGAEDEPELGQPGSLASSR
jgi:hypothetical protein